MLRRAGLPLLWAALIAGPTAASDFYTSAELRRVQDRAAPNLEAVLEEDIVGRMPRDLRPQAADIRLVFPETGPGPLAFYADPGARTVAMPLESIRFFDDVATLIAWIQSRGCAMEPVMTYLHALLRQRQPLEPPLTAFAIDRETAFADAFTYDVSAKAYSSGLQFILAHEVGHLVLGHRPGLDPAASQRQELEADAFAMEHFARLGAMPAGILFYYLAAWWTDPIGGDEPFSTHPVSPDRIAAVASRMAAAPMDFAHSEPDPQEGAARVVSVASDMATLARLAADDDMIRLTPFAMHRDFPLSRLAQVCPSD